MKNTPEPDLGAQGCRKYTVPPCGFTHFAHITGAPGRAFPPTGSGDGRAWCPPPCPRPLPAHGGLSLGSGKGTHFPFFAFWSSYHRNRALSSKKRRPADTKNLPRRMTEEVQRGPGRAEEAPGDQGRTECPSGQDACNEKLPSIREGNATILVTHYAAPET